MLGNGSDLAYFKFPEFGVWSHGTHGFKQGDNASNSCKIPKSPPVEYFTSSGDIEA